MTEVRYDKDCAIQPALDLISLHRSFAFTSSLLDQLCVSTT